MRLQPEQQIMLSVFDWIRLNKLDKYVWHCANERKCTPQYGALLKRMGVKAGVSDIFIGKACRGFNGAFLEVKAERGKPTTTQLVFLEDMAAEGYYTALVHGVDSVINTISWYLGIEPQVKS